LSERRRFPALRRTLAAFERRLLSLLLVYGVGRLLLTSGVFLLALYGLDRLFAPPVWFRLVLLALAIYGAGKIAWRHLLLPLRQRPAARDLAALLERYHPGLRDLIATAVEAERVHPGESASLKLAVAEQAEQALDQVSFSQAAPSGSARRSAFRGAGVAAVVLALALFRPLEASIFFDRLLGGTTPWPRATQLVMLPPYSAGEELELQTVAGGVFRLQAPQGSTLTLRVRAEGEVPDQVLASGPRGQRAMNSVGDGEFVLRLPALEEASVWEFRGGDDQDGTPELQLEPGFAPAIQDWLVQTTPPSYTAVPSQERSGNEFRVPQGTEMRLRFASDLPVAEAWLRHLNGEREQLEAQADGSYEYRWTAHQSGESSIELVGLDGFRNAQAGMLRWQAEPDTQPSVRFLFPDGRWNTVPGGKLPIVVEANDDYGLAAFALRLDGDSEALALPLEQGARQSRYRSLIEAPGPSAENFGADVRVRYFAEASDAAQPDAQSGEARTSPIEVLSIASYEERLAERMVRVRGRVEDLVERLQPVLEDPTTGQWAPVARRIDREVESLTAELEQSLTERVFSGLDRGASPVQAPLLDALQNGSLPPGGIVRALSANGMPPLLDRSALLLRLSRATLQASEGPAFAFRQAALAGEDPLASAQELDQQLRAILDDLLAWEDFQSAVDLLRGLLDRQRNLYLRTQEAAGR